MNKPDRMDLMAYFAGILVTLLLCAKCSQGQYYYQSPCQNGQCPPQYSQPQYQQQPSREVYIQPDQPQTQPGAQPVDSDIRIECESARGSGTGIARTANGGTYIVTNYHVIKGQNSITVHSGTNQTATATVADYDEGEDVAILVITESWGFVNLGDDVAVGTDVHFRAFDSGIRFRKYFGRVTANYSQQDGSPGCFASGNSVPGNSGGGVYCKGLFVGMIWGSPDGQTAFLPCSVIRRILDRLRGGNSTPMVPLPERENPCPSCPQGSCDCDGKITKLISQQERSLAIMEKMEERILLLETRKSEPGPAGPQGIQGEPGAPGKDANTTNLEKRIAELENRKIKLEIYRDGELVGVSEGKSIVRVNIKQLEESLQGNKEN